MFCWLGLIQPKNLDNAFFYIQVSLGIIDFFIETAFVAGLWIQFKKLRWEYN